MKFARLIRVAALTAAFGGAAVYAHAQDGSDAAPAGDADPLLATVNGDEIHQSDVLRVIATLPPQVQSMPPQIIMPAIVDQIINGKLIAQEGYEQDLQQTEEVQERLERAEERFVQEVYLTRAVEERITPERLQEAYEEYLRQNPPQEEVKASHILVETEEEAQQIIDEIEGGADFASIARERSTDTAAAQQGGDLGYFTQDQMVEPFAEAAFAMEPDEVSDEPVQTQFGWHVIKVTDKRETTQPTLEEVRDELRNTLSETIIAEVVDTLRADAEIERFGDAAAEAAPGTPPGTPQAAPEAAPEAEGQPQQ